MQIWGKCWTRTTRKYKDVEAQILSYLMNFDGFHLQFFDDLHHRWLGEAKLSRKFSRWCTFCTRGQDRFHDQSIINALPNLWGRLGFWSCSKLVLWNKKILLVLFHSVHGVWKSQKKSHSTLQAKRTTFTFWVDKS